MAKFRNLGKIRTVGAMTVLAAAVFGACGKSVDLTGLDGGGGSLLVPKPGNCGEEERERWTWIQPRIPERKAVDLLFVLDTSLSLVPEREKLARAVPKFLETLSPEMDVRITTILAHGDESRWSGRLYSHDEDPRVLDPGILPREQAQSYLARSLERPAMDTTIGQGELLMRALERSLDDGPYAEIRSQGFYRPEAALAVVFVTDENDLCFDPTRHGYSEFPHFNSSFFSSESAAYRRYCLASDGSEAITPQSVLNKIHARMPGKAVAMAGVIHNEPENVPFWGEDAIGHGILELVAANARSEANSATGVIFDIGRSDYFDGLRQMASQIAGFFTGLSDFIITPISSIDLGSLFVTVNGRPVDWSYDPESRTVSIPPAQAGAPGAQVEISACSQ